MVETSESKLPLLAGGRHDGGADAATHVHAHAHADFSATVACPLCGSRLTVEEAAAARRVRRRAVLRRVAIVLSVVLLLLLAGHVLHPHRHHGRRHRGPGGPEDGENGGGRRGWFHHHGHHGRHDEEGERRTEIAGLAQPFSFVEEVIAANGHDTEWMKEQGFRLISVSETDQRWMSEDQILGLIRSKIHFMDVTDGDLESVPLIKPSIAYELPLKPAQQELVLPIAGNVSTENLSEWLTALTTSFKTRYYQSVSGQKAARWIYDQVVAVAEESADTVKVTVNEFKHTWPQASVIARIEAIESTTSSDEEELPAVIISAHLDSVNQWNPWFGASPGADDDGSGSATIFEAYRVLISSGFVPKRPLEFHWYSGEEGGLLGSQKVVAKYLADGIPVYGVFHSDMTGYTSSSKKEVIGVVTDFVDPELTGFLKSLVEEYSDIKWKETKCGIHTTNDDVSHITFSHVAKFSKLAVAFAVEMSLN
ncbi:hypothetical protein HK405_000008 [Cladochytrium tenue]|nr:hypothetical protein HK405_000008 [Cladochytrium tenue]